jgi:hypothetical protein
LQKEVTVTKTATVTTVTFFALTVKRSNCDKTAKLQIKQKNTVFLGNLEKGVTSVTS